MALAASLEEVDDFGVEAEMHQLARAQHHGGLELFIIRVAPDRFSQLLLGLSVDPRPIGAIFTDLAQAPRSNFPLHVVGVR